MLNLLENALADKTYEIVLRHTEHARKNVELHQIDREAGHPSELGDYDVLAFLPEQNVVLNMECKDMLQIHCLKDARRLRERIFGIPDRNEGHFEQIDARQRYLKENLGIISEALQWPLNPEDPPKVIAVYVTQRSYWWTKYPPRAVDAKFAQIELLEAFIDSL